MLDQGALVSPERCKPAADAAGYGPTGEVGAAKAESESELASTLEALLARKPKLVLVEALVKPALHWSEENADAVAAELAAQDAARPRTMASDEAEPAPPALLSGERVDWVAKARRERRRQGLRFATSWLLTFLIGGGIIAAAAFLMFGAMTPSGAARQLRDLNPAPARQSQSAPLPAAPARLPSFVPATFR